MAVQPRDLRTDNGAYSKQKRMLATHTIVGTFANGSGTLAPLTPVAFNTSTKKWVVWANGGSNDTNAVKGFVWHNPVTLHSTNDVQGIIMLRGRIHMADIVLPAGEDLDNLKNALRANARLLGIDVEGLDQIR